MERISYRNSGSLNWTTHTRRETGTEGGQAGCRALLANLKVIG